MRPNPMQVIDLEGTPSQVGEAHGEALRDTIRAHVDRADRWLHDGSALRLDGTTLAELWQPRVTANELAAPELIEEMRGIARGADVSFDRIFLLNSMLDIGSLRFPGCVGGMLGCTTFVVPEEAGTGMPIIGQTYDLDSFRQEFGVVTRIQPKGGPRQLLFTLAGMVGCAGLNDAGLGLVINYLSCRDCQPGKLHAVIVRQALGCRNLADAVTAPIAGARAAGSHYLLTDEHGNVVSVETSASQHALLYADGRPFGHTNHYLSDYLKPQEVIRPGSIGSSVSRYASLRRYLQRPDLDRAALLELTRSHDSFPRSICAHGQGHEPDELKGRTVAAMVMSPRERSMQICRGCACEGEYQSVSL